MLSTPRLEKGIIAFSLSPKEIVEKYEHKTARLHQRLKAIEKLQNKGWKIGLRFDPIIYHEEWKNTYTSFFEEVFDSVNMQNLHSVTLGPFRLPKLVYSNMVNLYPEEKLFTEKIDPNGKTISYHKELEHEMFGSLSEKLLNFINKNIFYPVHF